MGKLEIYTYQMKHIENTLRVVANAYDCKEKTTCLDRDVMQALQMARNILAGKMDEFVKR